MLQPPRLESDTQTYYAEYVANGQIMQSPTATINFTVEHLDGLITSLCWFYYLKEGRYSPIDNKSRGFIRVLREAC